MSRDYHEKTQGFKAYVPEDLRKEVDALLYDPIAEATAYGELSGLMTQLFRDWIDRHRGQSEIKIPAEPRHKGEQIFFRIPAPVYREVRVLLLDPKTGRPAYGALTNLVSGLLREWVEAQRKQT